MPIEWTDDDSVWMTSWGWWPSHPLDSQWVTSASTTGTISLVTPSAARSAVILTAGTMVYAYAPAFNPPPFTDVRARERQEQERQHEERRERQREERRQADARARELFLSLLSEENRGRYLGTDCILVRGSDGNLWEINCRTATGNLRRMTDGRRFCAHPELYMVGEDGSSYALPLLDAIITQMLALETDVAAVLRIANPY